MKPPSHSPPPADSRQGPQTSESSRDEGRKYIRGSSLLLAGRFLALAINMGVQVLLVRYLSRSDYGAFAYALGIASMGSSVMLMGMDKTIARFLPIYEAAGEHGKMVGAMLLAVGTILGLGVPAVLVIRLVEGSLLGTAVKDPLALSLLVILIALSPLMALNSLLQSLLAVFVGARAIFFRRHIFGPGVKMSAVLLAIVLAGSVHFLAWAYLAGSLLGLLVFGGVLGEAFRRKGLLSVPRTTGIKVPAREIYSHGVPLLSSEVLLVLRDSVTLILLEFFRSTTDVAGYRAVLPVARLNLVVLQSFSFLFIPLAARMFARAVPGAMNDLYWRTSGWMAILTLPMFAVTTVLAEPVTVLLFGQSYDDSALVLAILAVGHYVHASLGFNNYTLRVQDKVKYLVFSDLMAAAVGLALNLVLIPRYGATGAAVAVMTTFLVHNVSNQLGLHRTGSDVRWLDWHYMGVYGLVAAGIGGLLVVRWITDGAVLPLVLSTAFFVLLLIRLTRHVIRPAETFPELLRVPLVGRLVR